MKSIKWTLLILGLSMTNAFAHETTLSPTIKEIKVDNQQCIEAANDLMLQVTPKGDSQGRYYLIKQIIGEFEYTMESFSSHIANRQFIGKKLCRGVLSYSDMHLPFTKKFDAFYYVDNFKYLQITDANDGLLMLKIEKSQLSHLTERLEKQLEIATHFSGDSDMYREFEYGQHDIDRTISWSLFLNQNFTLNIPIHGGKDKFPLLFTLQDHLASVQFLSISSPEDIKLTVTQLTQVINIIKNVQKSREESIQALNKIADEDAYITSIDLRTDKWVITKTKKI